MARVRPAAPRARRHARRPHGRARRGRRRRLPQAAWVAVGSPVADGASALARLLADAVDATRTAEEVGLRGWVPEPAHLAVERLLLAQRELAEAAVEHELGPLLRDERLGPELIETLQVYFDAGENMRETARQLHLANRTVAYRLARDRGAARGARSTARPGAGSRSRCSSAGSSRAATEVLGTLIVSPLASRIRDPEARHRLTGQATAAMLDRGATNVEVHEVSEPATIRAAAEAAIARDSGLVVVAGGDGTVRDASSVLAGTGIPVGILPCGTGNLYASAVGVPRDLRQALVAVRAGIPAPHDVGPGAPHRARRRRPSWTVASSSPAGPASMPA